MLKIAVGTLQAHNSFISPHLNDGISVFNGYAADWPLEQLLRAAQSAADRIDELIVDPANSS